MFDCFRREVGKHKPVAPPIYVAIGQLLHVPPGVSSVFLKELGQFIIKEKVLLNSKVANKIVQLNIRKFYR